jgi:hypothetical protein
VGAKTVNVESGSLSVAFRSAAFTAAKNDVKRPSLSAVSTIFFIAACVMGPPVDMVAVDVGAGFDVTWGGCVVAHPANNAIVVIMTANTRKILFFFKPYSSASLIIQRGLTLN